MGYRTDALLGDETLGFIAAILTLAFVIITFFVNFYIPFKQERDYIKMEIRRSCEEEAYRYWKKELKYLYLRSIPLIGWFFR